MKLIHLLEAPRAEELKYLYTPNKISEAEFMKWCKENASGFLNAKEAIYRGFSAPELGIIDTNGMKRKSANTANYYTLWMDNTPEWNEYPKRSKSLVCSTTPSYAYGFGDVNIIIPADKNKIGICSSFDLWESFKYVTRKFAMSLNELMMAVGDVISYRFSKSIAGQAEDDYKLFEKCIKEITIKDIEASGIFDYTKDSLLKHFKEEKLNTFYDFFKVLMVPDKNSFEHATGSTFKADFKNNEVWVQGECVTMNLKHLKKIINEADDENDFYHFLIENNFDEIHTHGRLR